MDTLPIVQRTSYGYLVRFFKRRAIKVHFVDFYHIRKVEEYYQPTLILTALGASNVALRRGWKEVWVYLYVTPYVQQIGMHNHSTVAAYKLKPAALPLPAHFKVDFNANYIWKDSK
jgi:hypothetical protein